jgi:FkbM family methyltransferase
MTSFERWAGERDLLKLDVEGHELAALKGADALLRTSRPTILVELNLDAGGCGTAGG